MKLNTLFVTAILASTTLSSCVFKTADENQLKYTHTTLVDGDAYVILREVGSIAPYELDYAKHVATVGNAQAKDAANKVSAFFSEMIPQMDTLGVKLHFDFPILGQEKFVAPSAHAAVTAAVEADSTADSTAVHAHHDHAGAAHGTGYSDAGYLQHAQHQVAIVKKQLGRLSRNTNVDLRNFAQSKLESVAALYTALGGKEDAHGHH
ncbi:hypothetical protein ACFRAE_01875 [Sphingobacterium sp. HJSM2_6]|uniref:hypothetical protein n=1 Tax=Sphingobacterium sp. HJSM2_6 TaxID=3366264 RepID=UPI003BC1D602